MTVTRLLMRQKLDTYGLEIAPARDNVLLVAVSVALDAVAHPAK